MLKETIEKTPLIITDEWVARVEDIGILCNKP